MDFKLSTIEDIDAIFKFYDWAVAFQKEKFNKHWKGFERSLIEKEVAERRQWKILVDNEIACVFAITFEDESIWKEKNKQLGQLELGLDGEEIVLKATEKSASLRAIIRLILRLSNAKTLRKKKSQKN